MSLPLEEAERVQRGKTNGDARSQRADQAMQSNTGGIDFNSDKMDLQVQNAGKSIRFKIDPAMLQQLQNAPGFVPVIVNI